MSKKPSPQPTTATRDNQTPFERFKAAMLVALTVPKSSLPKTHKKTSKKLGSP